jgi:hypothetical protein
MTPVTCQNIKKAGINYLMNRVINYPDSLEGKSEEIITIKEILKQ